MATKVTILIFWTYIITVKTELLTWLDGLMWYQRIIL